MGPFPDMDVTKIGERELGYEHGEQEKWNWEQNLEP